MESDEVTLDSIRELLAQRKQRDPRIAKTKLMSRSLSSIYGHGNNNEKKTMRNVRHYNKRTFQHTEIRQQFDKDQFDRKLSMLPFLDTIHAVEESLHVDDTYAGDAKSVALRLDQQVSSVDRLVQIQRKYPRFSPNVKLSGVKEVRVRSDMWVSKFMEDCYDYVTVSYTTFSEVNGSKIIGQKRGVLSLADSFPVLVTKLIANTYSVMEVRCSVVAEILWTIETILEKTFAHTDDKNCQVSIKGDRVHIFAQLLSESWESETLYMFLHSRKSMQDTLNIQFKALCVSRVWTDQATESEVKTAATAPSQHSSESVDEVLVPLSSSELSTAARVKLSQTRKPDPTATSAIMSNTSSNAKVRTVPARLRECLSFIEDVRMTSVPLLSIDHAALGSVISSLCFKADNVASYLKRRTLAIVCHQYNEWCRSQGTDIMNEGIHFQGIPSGGAFVVPLYSLLYAVCDTWVRLPYDVKASITLKNDASVTLRKLNDIYDENCKKLREHSNAITTCEKVVAVHEGEVLRAEKLQKRLERRWEDGIASEEEVFQLHAVRVTVTQLVTERLRLRSDVLARRRSYEELQNYSESLWLQVMGVNSSSQGPSQSSGHSSGAAASAWRSEAVQALTRAAEYCISHASRMKLGASASTGTDGDFDLDQDVEYSRPFSRAELASREKLLNSREAARAYSPGNIFRRLRQLERDVDELSNIGVAELATLGLEPIAIDWFDADLLKKMSFDVNEDLTSDEKTIMVTKLVNEFAVDASGFVVAAAYTKAAAALVERMHADDEAARQVLVGSASKILDYLLDEFVEEFAGVELNEEVRECSISQAAETIVKLVSESICQEIVCSLVCDDSIVKLVRLQISRQAMLCRRIRRYLARKRSREIHAQLQSYTLVADAFYNRRRLHLSLSYLAYLVYITKSGRCVRVKSNTKHSKAALRVWADSARKMSLQRKYAEEADRRRVALQMEEDEYRRHTACVLLQAVIRGFVCRVKFRRHLNAKIIIGMWRCAKARAKTRELRLYHHRISECTLSVHYRRQLRSLRNSMVIWTKRSNASKGSKLLVDSIRRHLVRNRMRTWKLITTELRKLYIRATEAAIRIQCIFRLYFVKKRILNYYKFALSLRKAQALARRWILRRVFLWVLLRHKSAIKIQKLFRGQLERRRQTENKVMGIYSAALGNSFEKVKYFAVQFPELVYAITKEGNTMLHAAASGASKRILKYLLKLGLESNFRNYEGYTPLHFLIQSSAINRDECFDYMVEHGFDEEQGGPEGRTCLMMAAQYGRAHIAQQLLEYGADPSVPDDAGNTPLQVATSYSHNAVIAHLLEHNAEVNAPAAQGYYPLHYAVDSPEPVDTCNLLFDYGAEVNVYHSETFEYPIMSACSRGSADLVNLFLYRGADVACVDRNGWSIAHYAAAQMPCVTEMYSHLLTADTYFESRDNEGNTPMHIAAMYGNYLFMKCLVEGGVGVGAQNLQGDSPSHLAAKYNYVDCLRLICSYETDIGRLNYQNQTPLGCANFYGAVEAAAYLESHYDKLAAPSLPVASELLADGIRDWNVEVDGLGQRVYVHRLTDERRSTPPAISSDLLGKKSAVVAPYRKKAAMVIESKTTTTNEYRKEVQGTRRDIGDMVKELLAVALLAKRFRLRIAYKKKLREDNERRYRRIIYRFIARNVQFVDLIRRKRHQRVALVQAHWRGYHLRRVFYTSGEYDARWWQSMRLRLALMIYRIWKRYKLIRLVIQLRYMSFVPQTYEQWQELVKQSSLVRSMGVYEEYRFASIFFYRHSITGTCTFKKPPRIAQLDIQVREEGLQRTMGYTHAQLLLVIRLQALVRGRLTRVSYIKAEAAAAMADSALEVYLKHPDVDENVFNYALYCHVVMDDANRARNVYLDCFRRMERRGPDVALVLYSYAIFGFVLHETDYSDTREMLFRARAAELQEEIVRRREGGEQTDASDLVESYRYGRAYDMVHLGFFKRYAESLDTCMSWHQLAACYFLIYNDFENSFAAFVHGFERDANNKKLKKNLDILLQHFYGDDAEKKTQFMQTYMQRHTKPSAHKRR